MGIIFNQKERHETEVLKILQPGNSHRLGVSHQIDGFYELDFIRTHLVQKVCVKCCYLKFYKKLLNQDSKFL